MKTSTTAVSTDTVKSKPTRAEYIQAAIDTAGKSAQAQDALKQESKPTRTEYIQAAIDAVNMPQVSLSREIMPFGSVQTERNSETAPKLSREIRPFGAAGTEGRAAYIQEAIDAVSPKNARKTMFSLQADADVQKQLRDYSFSLAGDRNAQLNREAEMKSMQDDERALYLYLVKNRGIEEAEEYRKELGLASRALPEERESAENAGFLGKLGVAAYSGLTDALTGMAAAGDAIRGRTPLNNPFDAVSGAARHSIGSGVGRTVFDLVKTSANQLPAMAMGFATGMPGLQTVLMSTGAGGNAYKQGLNEGMTKKQATAYGLINGLSEYLTESLVGFMPGPGGKIDLAEKAKSAIAKNVNSAVGRFAANYGVNFLGEATEEYLQEVLDPLYRYAATGEAQEWDISELWSEEALYSALLGGLSGGMLGGIIDGINGYRAESDYDYYQSALDSGEAIRVWQSEDIDNRTLTAVTEETVQQVALFSEATQTPVLWVKPGVLPSGVNAQEAGGVVFLSADAGKPLEALLAHETLHSTEGTQAHTALLEEVDAAIRAENTSLNLDSVAELYQQNCKTNYNEDMTIEAAKNEVAAQYVESNLLNSPLAMQLIMSRNSGLIREIAAKWNYRLAYRQADEAGQRSLRLQKDFAEGLRQRQRPTAEQIGETIERVGRGDTTGARYSREARADAQVDITARYQAAVDDVLNMRNTKQDNLIIGYTPELMQEMGMPSLPFVIGTGHVYSAAKTEAEAKQDGNYRKGVHYHGLGENVVKNIYTQLQDPVMIIAAKDVNPNATPMRSTHSVVAIVDVGQAGKSLLLPVEITAERSIGGQRMDVNVLSSIYERGVIPLIKEAVALENSGDVGIYYAKKEATNLIGAGVRFPVQLQAQMASNPIIRSFDAKVNRKISDVTQSLQFKRWFGDWQNHPDSASKVVNADGTPKVVYHQTDAEFTVFNTDNQRAGRLDTDTPTGMFFKPTNEDIGINGSKQMAVYLNARNILDFKNREEAHKYWIDHIPQYAELQAQYDAVDEIYNKRYEEAEAAGDEWYEQHYDDLVSGKISDDEAMQVMDAPLDEILSEWKSKTEPIAVRQKELVTDYIKQSPYDGMHLKFDGRRNGVDVETYIVFSPTQIKSATDNIGTFDPTNPDIRYSREGESFASLMEQMQEKIKQYGGMALPDREIDVPQSVQEGTFVSQTASTLLNDPKIRDNEEAKSVHIRQIVEGAHNRKRMNFPETLRKERENIQKIGYDSVVKETQVMLEDSGVLSERELMRVVALREAALDAGDWNTVQDCNVLIANTETSSARNMAIARYLLEGLDSEHAAKAIRRDIERHNEKAAETARKSRGDVPQETIDRLKEKKAEMEKDYRQAETENAEKQKAVRDLRRHLDELQKGITETEGDTKRTDKQTEKLAKELAQKMQDAVAAADSFTASEEKFQKTKQELREARKELRRLERQTKANERAEYQYLWDLLLVNERLETAVEEQRQSAEKLRETKKELDRSKEYRKLKEDLQKLGAGIEIPQALWDELSAAQTPEEIEAVKARIFKEAADQLPPTLYERFMSWRYLAMLGNLKTWIKNEVGNLANFGLHKLDSTVAYALQKFFLKEGNRIVALNWRHTDAGKAIMDKVNEAADAATEREGAHKYTDAQSQVQEYRRRFNSDLLEKASDGLDTALNEGAVTALTGGKIKFGAGDKPMFRLNYIDALGNYMVANGLTEVTAEADAHATKIAQDYVFHTQNAAAQVLTQFRNSGKVQKVIIDSLMPFIRTPANVLAQGLQRSPIGLAAASVKLVKALAAQKRGTGSVTPEIINSMARSTTGAVLFTLGVLLSAVGVASGDEEGDDAKGRAAGELSGAQDLSFNILGTRISFDWLEPASYPFLLGVLMQDGYRREDPVGSLLDAASAGFGQVFEMSMLSGLLDAVTSNYDDGSQMIAQAVAAVFENAATQSIPTIVGQLARAVDPVKRKTTSGESWITDVLGKNLVSDAASTVAARIPGLSQTLEPERDVWGNEVGRVGDSQAILLNAFQQLLSPASIKVKGSNGEQADDLSAILAGLYEKTEQGKVIPTELKAKDFKKKLDDEGLADKYTSELYQETREDVGKAQLEALWEMIDQNKAVKLTKTEKTENGEKKSRSYTKRFADMDDDEKAKAVQKTAQDAKEDVLEELLLELEKGAKKR